MLIATALTVAVIAASSVLAARPITTLPPISVNVSVAADISPSLVPRVLAEARELWLVAGVDFVWRPAAAEVVPYARVSETGPYTPSTLRITIGHARGVVRDEMSMPLGWIVFDDAGAPKQEIYLSYRNASALMDQSRGIIGPIDRMPQSERELLLGRAMGRALAHELGHYLLASKAHSVQGLMKARLTAGELFSMPRNRFGIDAQQRAAIAGRLAPVLIARTEPPAAGRQSAGASRSPLFAGSTVPR